MPGYFYAYASKTGAKQSRPDWFDDDDNLAPPRVLVSTTGVWLVAPVQGAIDPETKSYETTVEGERSTAFVILSPTDDGPPAKRIDPPGRQGFA